MSRDSDEGDVAAEEGPNAQQSRKEITEVEVAEALKGTRRREPAFTIDRRALARKIAETLNETRETHPKELNDDRKTVFQLANRFLLSCVTEVDLDRYDVAYENLRAMLKNQSRPIKIHLRAFAPKTGWTRVTFSSVSDWSTFANLAQSPRSSGSSKWGRHVSPPWMLCVSLEVRSRNSELDVVDPQHLTPTKLEWHLLLYVQPDEVPNCLQLLDNSVRVKWSWDIWRKGRGLDSFEKQNDVLSVSLSQFARETDRLDSFEKENDVLPPMLIAAALECPPLQQIVPLWGRTQFPNGVVLTFDQVVDFVADWAPKLTDLGFAVRLPKWLNSGGPKPQLTIKYKSDSILKSAPGNFSWDELLNFRADVYLDGCQLTAEEINALVEAHRPFIATRGKWFFLNHSNYDNVVEQLQKLRSGELRVADLLRLELRESSERTLTNSDENDSLSEIRRIVTRLRQHDQLCDVSPPKSLHATLRHYQQQGLSWLVFLSRLKLGACLADDMGLGKTIQTLAWLLHVRQEGETRPALLVCPKSVIPNWLKECKTFAPELRPYEHHGASRVRDETPFWAIASRRSLVITSYNVMQRDVDILRKVDWSAVILDEAQNIKNPTTKQTKAAKKIEASFRLALTGTPVENRESDLWSIMDFLNPGFLGTLADFEREFVGIDGESSAQPNLDKLRRLTSPFILRRVKTDKSIAPELPELIERNQYCSLTVEQATLYEAVLTDAREAVKTSEAGRRGMALLRILQQLKQVCNHPAHYQKDHSPMTNGNGESRSGKLERLCDLLSNILDRREHVLIFSQYRQMGELLTPYLSEKFQKEVLFFHGQLSAADRERLREQFQNDEANEFPILVLSLKSGGVGINLQRANHVIHYDRWWNPAVEDQATSRAFRIGQTRDVIVHKFVCGGTLEDRIDKIIAEKKTLAGQLISRTGEKGLANLSAEEFLSLIELDKDLAVHCG